MVSNCYSTVASGNCYNTVTIGSCYNTVTSGNSFFCSKHFQKISVVEFYKTFFIEHPLFPNTYFNINILRCPFYVHGTVHR